MSLWILQPDAQGNCCDCAGRTEPCDSCGGNCPVCVAECVSQTSGYTCPGQTYVNGPGTSCTTANQDVPGCPEFPSQRILTTAKIRLVITKLTPNVQTTAHVFFSDNTWHDFVFTPTSDSYTTKYLDIPNPAFNAAGIELNGCTVDCPCECALLMGVFNEGYPPPPYADYATAADAIAKEAINCLGWFPKIGANIPAGTVAFNGTTLTVTAHNSASSTVLTYHSLSLKSGEILTIPFTIATDGDATTTVIQLLDCTKGVLMHVDSITRTSGTFHLTVPVNGVCILLIESAPLGRLPTFFNVNYTVTCSGVFGVNPVIALWDDSGTTRQLEACPKMLLPPLTESTENWYSNLSAAQDVINHDVVDCFTYLDVNFGGVVKSAISTSLGKATFNQASWGGGYFVPWFSVNLVKGSSITATSSITSNMTDGCNPVSPFNCSIGAASIFVLDNTGVAIAADSITNNGQVAATISVTFIAPYTGRYIVKGLGLSNTWRIFSPIWTANGSVSIAGGTITNNPVQALYDVGLDCPARLNCS